MATLYSHQDANSRRTWLLMSLFFGIVVLVGWLLSYYFGNPAILYVAIIFSLGMNIFSYWFSDKIVIASSRARLASESEFADLHNIVENLSITAGLPKPRVYIIDDSAPNAFATGRNAEHAVVAVTTGILKLLDRAELEGVIAHELSHIGNRDMLVATVAVVLVGFVSIASDIFMRTAHHGGDNRKGGGVLILVAIILAVLAPLFANMLKLAVSRRREFLADASGALLTRYPEGLASALQKIGAYSQPMKHANHATAHIFLSSPFGSQKDKTSFFVKLFSTHPPISERVQALLER